MGATDFDWVALEFIACAFEDAEGVAAAVACGCGVEHPAAPSSNRQANAPRIVVIFFIVLALHNLTGATTSRYDSMMRGLQVSDGYFRPVVAGDNVLALLTKVHFK